MRETEENRFAKQLEEANRNASVADKKLLREFYRMMKQIESIPELPEPEPAVQEEQPRRPVPLRLVRRCLGRDV